MKCTFTETDKDMLNKAITKCYRAIYPGESSTSELSMEEKLKRIELELHQRKLDVETMIKSANNEELKVIASTQRKLTSIRKEEKVAAALEKDQLLKEMRDKKNWEKMN